MKRETNNSQNWLIRFLLPATALMNQLTYKQKLVLIILLFVVPCLFLNYLVVSQANNRIHFSKKEIFGTQYLQPLMRQKQSVLDLQILWKISVAEDAENRSALTQKIRETDEGFLKLESIHRTVGTKLDAAQEFRQMVETWQVLKKAVQDPSIQYRDDLCVRLNENMRTFMAHIANTSNLILDSELDTYYLMDSVLLKLPEAKNIIGKVRLLGLDVLSEGQLTPEGKVAFPQLYGLLDFNAKGVKSGLRTAFDNNPNQNLRISLRRLLEDFDEAVALLMASINRIVFINTLSSNLQSIVQAHEEALKRTSLTSLVLFDREIIELRTLLSARIHKFEQKRNITITVSLLLTLLTLYLCVAFYMSVMRVVKLLGDATGRMEKGEIMGAVELETRDEMGDVVRSFNQVAANLAQKADKLHASEKLLFSTLQALPVIVFCKDIQKEFRWSVWNKKAEDVFGIKAEDCLGKTDSDFFPKEQADWFRKKDIEASKTTETIDIPEEIVETKNGPVILHTRKIVIRDSKGAPLLLLGVSEDITAQKKAEKILKESEEKLSKMADSVPGVVYQYSLDKQGAQKFIYMSAFAETLFGVSPKEIEKDFNLMWNLILPEDIENLVQSIQRSAETFKPWSCEFRIKDKQGKIKYIQGDSTPEKPLEDGTIIWNGVLSDITPKKLLEQQLSQSQKMEAVGSLAGGIAHDFNNLLTVINGYSDLIAAKLKSDDPLRPKVEEIQKAGSRAAGLTAQLLAFSRRHVIQTQIVDINEQIVDMDQMIRRLMTEQIELVTLQASDLWMVKADPGQFQQLVMNLVVNARDAMEEGGKITLETQNKTLDEEYISDQVKIPAGKYVVLAVSDTGCGMSDEVKKRIFEPFFTTKEQGKGTGLGLATCFGIVQQSDGHIYVNSILNQGSTFKVYLPFAGEKAIAVNKGQAEAPLPRGKETVLLVEDEDGLRAFAGELLRDLGYETLEAENGEVALRMLEENRSKKIQLVLTDVIMPRMGGKELARKVHKLYPRMKIMFMSGYTGSDMTDSLDEKIQFLQKPFSLKQLSFKMRAVLDVA